MTTREVIQDLIDELSGSNMTFDEAMQGLSEMGIKNQKVVKVILTSIGKYYVRNGQEKRC